MKVEKFITLGINSSLLIKLFSVNINYKIIKSSCLDCKYAKIPAVYLILCQCFSYGFVCFCFLFKNMQNKYMTSNLKISKPFLSKTDTQLRNTDI